MKTRTFTLVIAIALTLSAGIIVTGVYAHCQIPCGIYDDTARIEAVAEHITTIEKSMKQIVELSRAKSPDHNQVVRWVNNKDQHADELAEIVTYYFMAQRVKPGADKGSQAYQQYVEQLTLLHEMLVTSMKCKQTTDLAHIASLRAQLEKFKAAYSK
ncbi:MAG: superoxide dismutase [Ni] [Planctomycetota bacterium]